MPNRTGPNRAQPRSAGPSGGRPAPAAGCRRRRGVRAAGAGLRGYRVGTGGCGGVSGWVPGGEGGAVRGRCPGRDAAGGCSRCSRRPLCLSSRSVPAAAPCAVSRGGRCQRGCGVGERVEAALGLEQSWGLPGRLGCSQAPQWAARCPPEGRSVLLRGGSDGEGRDGASSVTHPPGTGGCAIAAAIPWTWSRRSPGSEGSDWVWAGPAPPSSGVSAVTELAAPGLWGCVTAVSHQVGAGRGLLRGCGSQCVSRLCGPTWPRSGGLKGMGCGSLSSLIAFLLLDDQILSLHLVPNLQSELALGSLSFPIL